jgi:hypothetical protein
MVWPFTVAIPITSFLHFDIATLTDLYTKTKAEFERQLLAGQTFSHSSRNRGGVDFRALTETLQAIKYSIELNGGTLVDETVADLSQEQV